MLTIMFFILAELYYGYIFFSFLCFDNFFVMVKYFDNFLCLSCFNIDETIAMLKKKYME